MASKRYTVQDVENAIKDSYSWRSVFEKCGLSYGGSNYETIRNIADREGFNYTHFKGQGWNLNGKSHNEIPLEDCLKKGVSCYSKSLKKKLLKAGLITYKCSKCNNDGKWMEARLVLQLDHKNGNNMDNRLENLRLLCPNCHSQTKTYCIRKGAERKFCKCGATLFHNNKTGYCKKCYMDSDIFKSYFGATCSKSEGAKILKEMSSDELEILTKKLTLGEIGEMFNLSESSVSRICIGKDIRTKCKSRPHKRKFEVSKDELVGLIKEKSFCEIGRKFGVSDNAIRKRAKRYGII